jgi:hypothetical protein
MPRADAEVGAMTAEPRAVAATSMSASLRTWSSLLYISEVRDCPSNDEEHKVRGHKKMC